jgi:hypothetical protein
VETLEIMFAPGYYWPGSFDSIVMCIFFATDASNSAMDYDGEVDESYDRHSV